MDSISAMTGSDPVAGMAAAVALTTSNEDNKISMTLLKDNEAASLAAVTMATSLPDNPNLGRNVNVSV